MRLPIEQLFDFMHIYKKSHLEGRISMANQQFEQSNNPYWYPQLPDGFNEQHRGGQRQPVPMPLPNYHTPASQPAWSPGFQQYPHGGQSGMIGAPFPFFGGFPTFPSSPGSGATFPPYQQGGNQPPQNPPPNWTPEYPAVQTFAVDPGAISGCMYRFTYVWLSRRQGFWFFPVFVGRTSVAGYRWNSRRRRWEYTGLDLNQINSFTCI